MLAVSGGRLLLLSTPAGKRGTFYESWEHGGDAWERIHVTAEQVPRIPPAFLESERAAMGESMFAQEYGGAFVEADDQLFADDAIDGMFFEPAAA
jgi:hypothetical protein